MSSEVSIRTASNDDAEVLAELGARTFRETYRSRVAVAALEEYVERAFSLERTSAELADPTSAFLVARRDGDAVGYAHLKATDPPAIVRGPRPVELVRIYLERDEIGSGTGARLMEACLERAESDGYETVWLGVW